MDGNAVLTGLRATGADRLLRHEARAVLGVDSNAVLTGLRAAGADRLRCHKAGAVLGVDGNAVLTGLRATGTDRLRLGAAGQHIDLCRGRAAAPMVGGFGGNGGGKRICSRRFTVVAAAPRHRDVQHRAGDVARLVTGKPEVFAARDGAIQSVRQLPVCVVDGVDGLFACLYQRISVLRSHIAVPVIVKAR